MSFTLKIQENLESREITSQNYTIKDLILELGLSAQTVVAKQNGELVIEDT